MSFVQSYHARSPLFPGKSSPWGYAHLIEVLADPDNEEYNEMVEWCGSEIDPAFVDEAAIRKALTTFANRRRRKPKAKPQS